MKRVVFEIGPSEVVRRVTIDFEELYDHVYKAAWHLEVNRETSLENAKRALRDARALLDQMCAGEDEEPPKYGSSTAIVSKRGAYIWGPSAAGDLPRFISVS